MTQPETKTVLGRVFTKHPRWWQCQLMSGERSLRLEQDCNDEHVAILFDDDAHVNIETGRGLSESDAILALQATLRKMAELEVSGD